MSAFGILFLGYEPSFRITGATEHLGSREGVLRKNLKHPHHSEKDIPAGDNGTGIELHIGLVPFEVATHSPELVRLGKRGHFGQVQ
jgi:hypothetical protein